MPAEPGARDSANGGFSANGVRSNGQNNFLLNGVDNNINTIDFLNQTSYAIGPAIDAVSEISIQTNGYNAEYGRAAGGVINVTLKSGTNALHGSLFEYLQNKDLDANTWTNNRAGAAARTVRAEPVRRDGRRPDPQEQALHLRRLPGNAHRRFRRFGAQPGLLGIHHGSHRGDEDRQFLQPAGRRLTPAPTSTAIRSRSQRARSTIRCRPPTRRMPPASRFRCRAHRSRATSFPPTEWIRHGPRSSSSTRIRISRCITGNAPTNDYYYNTTGGLVTDQGDARVDYRLSDKDSLFGSLSWSNTSKSDGAPLPGALDDTGFNGAGEIDLSRNAQISYTHVWSPSLVTESRVGFTRLVTSRIGANPSTDLFQQFGIGGYDPTTATANNGGLPQIGFGNGYPTVGATDWVPTKEYNNVWDLVQNVALSKGAHAYKFGFEFRSVKFPFFQVPDPHGNHRFQQQRNRVPLGQHRLEWIEHQRSDRRFHGVGLVGHGR